MPRYLTFLAGLVWFFFLSTSLGAPSLFISPFAKDASLSLDSYNSDLDVVPSESKSVRIGFGTFLKIQDPFSKEDHDNIVVLLSEPKIIDPTTKVTIAMQIDPVEAVVAETHYTDIQKFNVELPKGMKTTFSIETNVRLDDLRIPGTPFDPLEMRPDFAKDVLLPRLSGDEVINIKNECRDQAPYAKSVFKTKWTYLKKRFKSNII